MEDKSQDFKMYANFISKDIYDIYDNDRLKELIPKDNATFSTMDKNENFLYIKLDDEDNNNYLYVSVETSYNTKVKFLSTFSTFESSVCLPNPSTTQLHTINTDMKFIFSNHKDIAINIVSMIGRGIIFWQNQNFTNSIRGREGRISLLYTRQNEDEALDSTLIVQNDIQDIFDPEGKQIPGAFIFYMTINMRSIIINFDEFEYGKTFDFNYRNTNFPLSVYRKMNNLNKDINAFITLYHIEGEGMYSSKEKEIEVYVSIIGDISIYNIKNNIDVSIQKSKSFKATYDPSKRVCLISLKESEINSLIKIKDSNDLGENLVIQINDIKTNSENLTSYSIISLNGAVFEDDSLIPVSEKIYQFGKLKEGQKQIKFKLSTDPNRNFMFLSFSSNSDILDFKINLDKEIIDETIINEFYNNKMYSNGRIITYFYSNPDVHNYIYLTIFTKDNSTVKNNNLTNYVFKYINAEYISNVHFYPQDKADIAYSKDGSSYKITIESIKCNDSFVSYFVTFFQRSKLIINETFNNIAVVESPGYTEEFDYKSYQVINNKIDLIIKGISDDKDYAYIQVIAHIEKDPVNEYIAYNSRLFEKVADSRANNDEKDSMLIVIISVISGLFIIIVT